MPTKEDIAVAIAVIDEVAGAPESGVIAELKKQIEAAGIPTKEVRVASPKETR
jgi:hypothetical protein